MKLTLKKCLAFILSLTLIMSSFVVTAFAGRAREDRATVVPTVYVQGYGSTLYSDKNNIHSTPVYGGGTELIADGVIGSMIEQVIEPLMSAVQTGDYTEYNDIIVNTLVGELGKIGLDENGEASNGSGNLCEYKKPTKKNSYNGKYDLFAYTLTYDWRLDPMTIADELNQFIKDVKTATGCEKVNLVGRCLGANIVLAYLSKYGYDDINALQYYIGGFEGFEFFGALFSGRVEIESDALNKWFYSQSLETGDAQTDELITFAKALVAILNAINGLNLPLDLVYKVYDQVYTDIIPRVLIESFGSMPGMWSLVGNEYYEDAMALNFPTEVEQTKYAKLIEKIENYHNNVSLKTKEILDEAEKCGVPTYFFAKYGFATIPLSVEAKYISDGVVSTKSQSFGATTTELGKTFNRTYLKACEENGTLKYISPDKCIDASTCYSPEHTWFVKGSSHGMMPDGIDVMMAKIFNATGSGDNKTFVTVNDLENYPQYTYLETNDINAAMHPLTEENANIGDDQWNVSVFEQLTYFFEKVFSFITEFVNTILELIRNTEI